METVQQPVAASTAERFYKPGLDGLRTIAWAMVFCSHLLPWHIPYAPVPEEVKRWWTAAITGATYGVPLFYALSSFLITSLLMEEKRRTGTVHVRDFYVRRILRIWPLYYLILLLAFLATPTLVPNTPFTVGALGRYATFSGNFYVATGVLVPICVGPLWSVCVEEQFYLCWPVISKLLDKRGLTILAIGMILGGSALRVYICWGHVQSYAIFFSTFGQIDCFAYGCLAAIHLKGKDIASHGRKVALIALSFLGIWTLERIFQMRIGDPVSDSAGMAYTLIAALCAFIVWLGSSLTKGALVSKPMVEIGRRTYGLYCYHGLALAAVWSVIPRERWSLVAIPAVALTAALAFSSFQWFEMPFLKLKSKFQTVKSGAV